MRTPRGVLLHWDPPELIPKRLDGYVLEGRQGSQDWEILDQAVAGTEIQLLVPGLIKVCAEREGPPGDLTVSSSSLILSSHPDSAIFTSCPTSFLPLTAVFTKGTVAGSAGPDLLHGPPPLIPRILSMSSASPHSLMTMSVVPAT